MKREYIEDVCNIIIDDPKVLRATKYVSPSLIVRAVRKSYRYNNRKTRKNDNVEIILTIGRPNYLEREFINLCKKSKEPFPVKKIQMKLWKIG